MYIDAWYDRHTRLYIIQLKDINGYEVKNTYAGNKFSRDFEIEQYKNEFKIEHIFINNKEVMY